MKRTVSTQTASLVLCLFLASASGNSKELHPTSARSGSALLALKLFGESHAQCAMWTDWRHVCSRLGRAGQMSCRDDSTRRVTPSAPFCVAGAWAETPWEFADTPAAHRSRLRFCRKQTTETFDGRPTTVCRDYEPGRPYNGTRLSEIYDQHCDAVGTTASPQPVCSNNGKNGMQSCTPASRTKRLTNPAYCAEWKPILDCKTPVLGTATRNGPDGVTISTNVTLNSIPVWGIYCLNSASGEK